LRSRLSDIQLSPVSNTTLKMTSICKSTIIPVNSKVHHTQSCKQNLRAQPVRVASFRGDVSSLRVHHRASHESNARGSLVVQANLFDRVGRVAKSYANSLINAAEDPEKMLDQTVSEMQDDLIKMRQASAQVLASQKQLEAKTKQAQTTSDEWYRRAQLALQKGDEDLAREALKRRKGFQETADSLGTQLASQKEVTEKLIANTRMLESKITEAKSKKDQLKARAQSAKTQKQVQEMVGGLSNSSALAAFDRMEEKVMKLESESEATSMLVGGDSLDLEFAALEAGSVDDELASMKKRITGDVNQKVGEVNKKMSAIDLEMEELRRKAKEL